MKKKILVSFVCGVLLLSLTGCDKEKKEEKKIINEEKIILIDNLNLEINSDVKVLSLVSNNNKIEILNKDEVIDTSHLGEKEVVIKYKVNNEEKQYDFKVKIIDTVAPTIKYEKVLTTTQGKSINLLKDVLVTDNSKEEIKAQVEGNVNFNKVGEQKLKYVAIDSSGNKSEEKFTLKVNAKKASNNNSSNNNSNNVNNNNTSNSSSSSTNNSSLNNNSSNTNNNNSSNNNSTTNQKTCDLAKKQEIEEHYASSKAEAEKVIADATTKKQQNLAELEKFGGYISKADYEIALSQASSAMDKANLSMRRGLSNGCDVSDSLIKEAQLLIKQMTKDRAEMLKSINCD